MIGGPLDGTAYNDMPVMPDGEPALRVSVPLADSDEFAVYDRRPHIWLDGRWYYDFVEITVEPNPLQPAPFPTGTVLAKDDDPEVPQPFQPAPRFVAAQAWWVASELARRHSRLRVVDSWPTDGFYHGLELREQDEPSHVFLNFYGRIHLHGEGFAHEPIPWTTALAAESPHELVKTIESAMRWYTKGADPTTPRSLVYRVLSAFLTQRLNDKNRWYAVDGYSTNMELGETNESLALLDAFPGARELADRDTEPRPLNRFWMLVANKWIAFIIHDSGVLLQRNMKPVNLMSIYKKRRLLTDVLGVVAMATDMQLPS